MINPLAPSWLIIPPLLWRKKTVRLPLFLAPPLPQAQNNKQLWRNYHFFHLFIDPNGTTWGVVDSEFIITIIIIISGNSCAQKTHNLYGLCMNIQYLTLNDLSRGKQWILVPKNLNVSKMRWGKRFVMKQNNGNKNRTNFWKNALRFHVCVCVLTVP